MTAPPRSAPWLSLGLILLVGGALRFVALDATSFWLDEILSVERSNGHDTAVQWFARDRLIESPPDLVALRHAKPIRGIWTALDEEVHPPLYYIVLRVWRMIGFERDWGMRALSALASVGAIAALFLAVRNFAGADAPALWAAALLAVSGPQVEFAQENRSYTLLLLELLAAAAAIGAIQRSGPSWAPASLLTLAVLAGLLTHYAAAGPLAALGVYALLFLRGRERGFAVGAMAAGVLLFLLCWGPWLWRQQQRDMPEHVSFAQETSQAGAWRHLDRLATAPLRCLVTFRGTTPGHVAYVGVAVYLLAALALVRRDRGAAVWALLLGGALLPVMAADVAGGTRGLSFARYILPAGPAVAALVATALWPLRWPTPARVALPAAAAIGCLIMLPNVYGLPKEPWRMVGQYLDRALQSGDVLVLADRPEAPWLADTTYICADYYAARLPWPTLFASRPPAGAVAQSLHSFKRVWLLTPRRMESPRDLLPGWTLAEEIPLPMLTLAQLVPAASTPHSTPQVGGQSASDQERARGVHDRVR